MDPISNNKEPIQSTQEIPHKSKKKQIIWVLIVAILLVVVGWLAYSYGGYKQRQNNDDEVGYAYAADSVMQNGWATMEEYEYWKNATFTIPAYDAIPLGFKRSIVKIFMGNGYYTNEKDEVYFLTKIKDRAPKVFAYGNFTGQGDKEMAFLLEAQDYESSAIFIITEKGNLLFWKKYTNELPIIKRFSKSALIYMNELKLVPAPTEGIIRESKDSKYVLIYNATTKTFDEYYQYTENDLKERFDESDEGEMGDADSVDQE